MTRSRRTQRHAGASVLGRGVLLVVLFGMGLALLALMVSGRDAALGALVGSLGVLVVCATGSLLVDTVARLVPAASLMFALLTYTLQVLVMLLLFTGLDQSDLLDSTLDREWLGAAAIAATLAWLGSQLVLTTRLRIPLYDLPASEQSPTPVPSRSGATEASER